MQGEAPHNQLCQNYAKLGWVFLGYYGSLWVIRKVAITPQVFEISWKSPLNQIAGVGFEPTTFEL